MIKIKKFSFFFLLMSTIIVGFTSCEKQLKKQLEGFGFVQASDKELDQIDNISDFDMGTMPNSFSLNMPPVGNQGGIGSCCSFSTAYAGMSYFMNKNNGTNYNDNSQLCSPSFLYNQIRQGNNCKYGGSSYLDNFSILKNKGVCTLAEMPYSDPDCSSQPTSAQITAAAKNKLHSWKLVDKNNTNRIKSCLLAGYPVFIAINAYENLQTNTVYNSFSGQNLGGHAVTIVGYDNDRSAFKIQNSWGASVQDQGFFWIPYSFLPTAVISRECYVAFPVVTNANDNIQNGLLINLPFTGNANNTVSANYNGLVNGATLTNDRNGTSNAAYKFGGLNSPGSIKLAGSSGISSSYTDYTITFWARFDSRLADNGDGTGTADGNKSTSWQTIIYKGGNTGTLYNVAYAILLSSTNNNFGYYIGSNGGGNTSGVNNNIGTWHHYAVSKSGNQLKMYLDGIELWNFPSNYSNLWNGAPGYDIVIGKSEFPNSGVPFNGALDEFRFYNRALTISEVRTIQKL